MKKLVFAVVAFAVIGLSSCKKEEGATPESSKPSKAANKVTQQWD